MDRSMSSIRHQTLSVKEQKLWRRIRSNRTMYLLILPALIYIILFNYAPMYGILIAFKNYKPRLGIWGSPWAGLKYFEKFLKTPSFWPIVRNTFTLSLYQLGITFMLPILLALLLNQCGNSRFKKTVQNIVYVPHFISVVVLVGMLNIMFSTSSGVVNTFLEMLGHERVFFMGTQSAFKHLYVWSSAWQTMGFNSIIYIAALTSVGNELHEAAMIDGATKLQRIRHIDFPSILPTIMVMLILTIGRLMSLDFEKVFLMQNSINIPISEVISTYVYKKGLQDANYSLATAVGLLNNVVNLLLLVIANTLSKKLTESSLW